MTNDFITFSSVLGSSYAQALDFTDVGVVLYDSSEVMPDGTVVRRWLCSDDLAETSFIEMLREVFFDLEYAKTEFSVFGSYDPVMVCESFVRKDYFNARNSLTSGNHYRFKDYSLISYSITEVNADNTAFVAGFRYAFVPENWEHPYVWAGNTEIGTGEFEGMLIESRSFAMKLGEDVTWYCTDIGTGRASLPE